MTTLPLGIDIAKCKFNACLLCASGKPRHKVFSNTAVGFAQLCNWIGQQGAGLAHACIEATGTYGDLLAAHLHEAGHVVSVVRPGSRQSLHAEGSVAGIAMSYNEPLFTSNNEARAD